VTTAVSTNTNRRRSATTVVGAIAAVGAAVAVAGLGTMGSFTDSTTPVDTKVDTGVLSIDISQPSGVVPFDGGAMVAGDSRATLIDLVNDGNTPLSTVRLQTWATQSSVLDSDRSNGLQLRVDSCSVPWTTGGAAPTCAGTVRGYLDLPIIIDNQSLPGTAALAAGATDHLRLTASLPSTASSEAFEGATSNLSFQFTGVQRNGGAR
jgi:predicted ribosomally synthesized peptide with SipW-like signal peptide